jgi:hypothetical protein
MRDDPERPERTSAWRLRRQHHLPPALALGLAVPLLGLPLAAGHLSAMLVDGGWPSYSPTDAKGILWRLASEPGEPAAAWAPVNRGTAVPGPGAWWGTFLALAAVAAVAAVAAWLAVRSGWPAPEGAPAPDRAVAGRRDEPREHPTTGPASPLSADQRIAAWLHRGARTPPAPPADPSMPSERTGDDDTATVGSVHGATSPGNVTLLAEARCRFGR